jgi:hypothetical protein
MRRFRAGAVFAAVSIPLDATSKRESGSSPTSSSGAPRAPASATRALGYIGLSVLLIATPAPQAGFAFWTPTPLHRIFTGAHRTRFVVGAGVNASLRVRLFVDHRNRGRRPSPSLRLR